MNWNIVAVSCVAFFLIVGLVYFQVIGIDIGIVSSIVSLIGIFSPILSHLVKPKISLETEKPEFERREYGNYQGYKIVTQVTNKGKKIVFNLIASVHFKEQVEFLGVTIEVRNKQSSYRASIQPFKEDKYSWIDKEGKTLKDISLNQIISLDKLRKDDSFKLMFPKEAESGPSYVIGGHGRTVSYGSAYDILLKLETQKTYQVEITLKGEDFEKNTVIKKMTFKMKVPEVGSAPAS